MSSHHELIAAFLHAMAARDRDVLSGIIGEDAVWHVPPSSMPEFRGPHRGRDAILALVTGAGGLFVEGSQRIDIQHIIAEGELAAALFRQKARTTGGRDYDNLYTFFFRVRNGRNPAGTVAQRTSASEIKRLLALWLTRVEIRWMHRTARLILAIRLMAHLVAT